MSIATSQRPNYEAVPDIQHLNTFLVEAKSLSVDAIFLLDLISHECGAENWMKVKAMLEQIQTAFEPGTLWFQAYSASLIAADASNLDSMVTHTCLDLWEGTREPNRNMLSTNPTFDAARALVLRNVVGQYGFTQSHYDFLTRPWSRIVGRVHPDDSSQ